MGQITLQFQTPQDFQGFRKWAQEYITSYSVQQLSITCNCQVNHIADAITKFGGTIIEPQQ